MKLKYGVSAWVFVFVLFVPSFFLRAYVLAALWRWFAVPAGLPVIGMAHAYGLATLMQFAVSAVPSQKDRDIADLAVEERDATTKESAMFVMVHFVWLVVAPLLALALGYVAFRAMGQ